MTPYAILARVNSDIYSGELQDWNGEPLEVFLRKAADSSITCSWWYRPIVLQDNIRHMVFASGTMKEDGDTITGVLEYMWHKKDTRWRATKKRGEKRIEFEEVIS